MLKRRQWGHLDIWISENKVEFGVAKVEVATVARKLDKAGNVGQCGDNRIEDSSKKEKTCNCFMLSYFRIPSSSLHATKIPVLVSCA